MSDLENWVKVIHMLSHLSPLRGLYLGQFASRGCKILELCYGKQIHSSWPVTLATTLRSPICKPILPLLQDYNYVQFGSCVSKTYELWSREQIHYSYRVTLESRWRSLICNPFLALIKNNNHVQFVSPGSKTSPVTNYKAMPNINDYFHELCKHDMPTSLFDVCKHLKQLCKVHILC